MLDIFISTKTTESALPYDLKGMLICSLNAWFRLHSALCPCLVPTNLISEHALQGRFTWFTCRDDTLNAQESYLSFFEVDQIQSISLERSATCVPRYSSYGSLIDSRPHKILQVGYSSFELHSGSMSWHFIIKYHIMQLIAPNTIQINVENCTPSWLEWVLTVWRPLCTKRFWWP